VSLRHREARVAQHRRVRAGRGGGDAEPAGQFGGRAAARDDLQRNVSKGHAVVINVIRLNGRNYSGGHYATIVGYRASGNEFAVADPAYAGGRLAWVSASNVSSGIKLRRYVA